MNINNRSLIIKNIKVNYGKKIALDGITLQCSKKKITGLLGPNGSGKTTLFNTIVGFILPKDGQIYLGEKNITSSSLNERTSNGISYLPQETSIFRDLTVKENILSIAEIYYDKANSLKITDSLISRFSLENFKDRKGKLLSGGEKRRTEIARALVADPDFILLDEPFAGIDPIAIDEIKSIIINLKNSGVGIIITDHNVREALEIVDKAYIIHDGKIIKEGTSKQITEDPTVKKIYLGKTY